MHVFKRMDVSNKLNLLILTMVVIGVSALIWMVNLKVSELILQQVREYQLEIGKSAYQEVNLTLDHSFQTARAVKATGESLKEKNATDRDTFNEIHKNMLVAAPSLLGVWSGWEPEAFDGKDAQFVNTKGHDATGRYVPYWYRGKNGIALDPLVDYDKNGAGDYYMLTKSRGMETVLEPYFYELDGAQVLITSFATPIMHNGKLLGVAGVDYSLASLQKELQQLKPMGEGKVGLISMNGNWIVSLKDGDGGKNISGTEPALLPLLEAAKHGDQQLASLKLAYLGDDANVLLIPIKAGQGDSYWFIVVSIPESTIFAPLQMLRQILMGLGILVALVTALLGWASIHSLLRQPLRAIIRAITDISQGKFGSTLAAAKREDDIGTLAKAIENYKNARMNELNTETEREQMRQREKDAEDNRKRELSALGDSFATVVGGDAATGDNRPSFTAVAISTEEMFAAIQDIARQTSLAQDVVTRAVSESEAMQKDFAQLATVSQQISEVVSFISDIASRTNLLALNASIEAARAGESGRGFSIVAEEVKKLAHQTTQATEDISNQIKRVLTGIESSRGSVDAISTTVGQVSQVSATVAAAVEEQTASMKKIADTVQSIKREALSLLEHIRQS